jgi:ClpP class serine protease
MPDPTITPDGLSRQTFRAPMFAAPELADELRLAMNAGKPSHRGPRPVCSILEPYARAAEAACEPFLRAGRAAIVRLDGPIFFAASVWSWYLGGCSSTALVRAFDAAANDPTIEEVVVDIHSPGGDVFGRDELIAAVDRCAESKPTTALVHGMCGSMATWVASRCGGVAITPESWMGGIGSIVTLEDSSEAAAKHGYKVVAVTDAQLKAGGYGLPITDEIVDNYRELIFAEGAAFRASVAEGRGVNPDTIAGWNGRMFTAPRAVEIGLADRVVGAHDWYAEILGAHTETDMTAAPTRVSPGNTTPTTPAPKAETALEDKPLSAMTDDEKKEALAQLTAEVGTADDDEETPAAETTTPDKDEEPTARMTIAQARSVVSDFEIPEAAAKSIVLDAVEHNWAGAKLLSSCMAAQREHDGTETRRRELDRAAGGGQTPVSASPAAGGGEFPDFKSAVAHYQQTEKLTYPQACLKARDAHPDLRRAAFAPADLQEAG